MRHVSKFPLFWKQNTHLTRGCSKNRTWEEFDAFLKHSWVFLLKIISVFQVPDLHSLFGNLPKRCKWGLWGERNWSNKSFVLELKNQMKCSLWFLTRMDCISLRWLGSAEPSRTISAQGVICDDVCFRHWPNVHNHLAPELRCVPVYIFHFQTRRSGNGDPEAKGEAESADRRGGRQWRQFSRVAFPGPC